MPVNSSAADALGVVTICLVALLILLGFLCILYSFYFRARIRCQRFVHLSFFSGPWIIRISLILFAIWWGLGEIVRLSLLKREGRVLNALNWKFQETVCKCYIVSNLGFAEPCLFLSLVFLLRAPLQKMESGTLSQKWNGKTALYILLYSLPLLVLQLVVVLFGSKLNKEGVELPDYFTRIALKSKTGEDDDTALCTYPLLSTILLGVFATFLTVYLFWLGRRIMNLVINKNLQKRVYTLIFSVSGFLPLRVVLLGLSVLARPEHLPFEALVFFAFLALLCCAGVGICVLVYWPVADSLALRNLLDVEARRRISVDHNDTFCLIANQSHGEGSVGNSLDITSNASMKRESISFRAMGRGEASSGAGTFIELSAFSPAWHVSPPDSPRLLGLSTTQIRGP